ncbi:6-bladed beta-propeller [Candidatus Zixiibacteriota bacterium]
MRHLASASVCIVTILITACSSRPVTYQVEVIDGVEHVHNLASIWGDVPSLTLEHELTIGAGETSDKRYMLRTPSDAVLDQEGNIYILDRWRPGIRVYDETGVHLVDIGKRGSGPGEFIEALAMDRSENGELCIVDPPGGKITIMNDDGSFNRIFRPEGYFFSFRFLSDGRIVSSNVGYEQDPPQTWQIMDREGKRLGRFGVGEAHEERNVRIMFNNSQVEVGPGDDIYLCYWYRNLIEVYSVDGELKRRIDRPLPYPLDVGVEYQEFEEENGTVLIPRAVLNRISLGIGVDDEGRIWSLTYIEQPDRESDDRGAPYDTEILRFEVFESSGALLGYLPVPETCMAFRVSGDRILMADSIESGCVYVYQILEND